MRAYRNEYCTTHNVSRLSFSHIGGRAFTLVMGSTHAHWWRCSLRWWPVSTQRGQYATGVLARPYGCDAFIQFVSTIIYGRPPTGNSGVHHCGQGISISFFSVFQQSSALFAGTRLIVRYSFFELFQVESLFYIASFQITIGCSMLFISIFSVVILIKWIKSAFYLHEFSLDNIG